MGLFLSLQNKFFGNLNIFFFFKVQKVKYLPHLESNHRNFFSESFYGIPTNFVNINNLIQPPGEPREQHLGDVRPKTF